RHATIFNPRLQQSYLTIARSSHFANVLQRYNTIARILGQRQAATIPEIIRALRSQTAFARTPHWRSGVFGLGEHRASLPYLLQGNPLGRILGGRYGARAGAHELTHFGAALQGQANTIMHEIAVQLAANPENPVIVIAIGLGLITEGWWLFYE
ncbi:MAG TPA: hypothetical protein VM260_09850, partial [Pirellula sp.]|nr:hypothetical protein [Pirellula sp.]